MLKFDFDKGLDYADKMRPILQSRQWGNLVTLLYLVASAADSGVVRCRGRGSNRWV